MDDHTLHWWAALTHWAQIASLMVAAISAVCLGASVWFSKKFSHEIHERESAAFAKYKVDAGVLIEEAKRKGVEAAKAAGDAVLRAAELETEAALVKERAVQLEKDVAEANARAAEAQLALERFKAPRWITADQENKLVGRLKQFQNVAASVSLLHGSSADAGPFAARLASVLKSAQWKITGVDSLLSGHTGAGVIVVLRENPNARDAAAARALLAELESAQIVAEIRSDVTDDPVNALGVGDTPSPRADLWIVVGSKP